MADQQEPNVDDDELTDGLEDDDALENEVFAKDFADALKKALDRHDWDCTV
jgi:hypothetical protein